MPKEKLPLMKKALMAQLHLLQNVIARLLNAHATRSIERLAR
jgi:hypothetical protein